MYCTSCARQTEPVAASQPARQPDESQSRMSMFDDDDDFEAQLGLGVHIKEEGDTSDDETRT